MTNPNYKYMKGAQKTFVQKSACKILVKLTPGVTHDDQNIFIVQAIAYSSQIIHGKGKVFNL